MMKSRFSDSQIVAILKQAEGVPVSKVCGEHSISSATLYNWRRKSRTSTSALAPSLPSQAQRQEPLNEQPEVGSSTPSDYIQPNLVS